MSYPKLGEGRHTYEIVTCTLANTDYASSEAPVWADCVVVFTDSNVAILAYGKASGAGVCIAVNTTPQVLRLSRTIRELVTQVAQGSPSQQVLVGPKVVTDENFDNKMHVQSPTAGTKVYLSYMTE